MSQQLKRQLHKPLRFAFRFVQRISHERLVMVNTITFSAQLYLDHCNGNSYLSKKPEAVFFRNLVQAFPEVRFLEA